MNELPQLRPFSKKSETITVIQPSRILAESRVGALSSLKCLLPCLLVTETNLSSSVSDFLFCSLSQDICSVSGPVCLCFLTKDANICVETATLQAATSEP